jgi:hypothetical protein
MLLKRLTRFLRSAAVFVWILASLSHGTAGAAEGRNDAFFESRIRPLLADHCYECHGGNRADGGLALDHRDALLKGGVSGPGLIPGDAGRSRIVGIVSGADSKASRTARHRIAPEQLADLVAWVNMGAPDPRSADVTARVPKVEPDRHWAFQPIQEPAVPEVTHRRWVNNPVDRFILAPIERAGLAPALPADRRTLIRRVTFDLTGLPPTLAEIDQFLRDRSADAFGKVVERLLASPHYGERWGRHWLDVARYADSSGDSSDYPIPQARLYRDYVIAAFNEDKPYDAFLREQIAGDLLGGEDQSHGNERIIATGFIALSRRFSAGGPETRHLMIENTLDTLGHAVLGLSMSCARCHDHKHDPITMRDYYALYGIFDSTIYPHPGSEGRSYQTNFVPLIPAAEVEARMTPYRDQIAAYDAEIARMEDHLNALVKEGLGTDELKPAYEKVWKARDALTADPPQIEDAYAVTDGKIMNARVQKRGDPYNLGEEVPRGFLKILGGQEVPRHCSGSGRLELAGWLTDPANPLTARVMVNRIWQHHFGSGLVATPSDFGSHGRRPTHPELLDYLALRFIEGGWSVKAMHRLMVGSATYQQGTDEFTVGGLANGRSRLAIGDVRKEGSDGAGRDADPPAADSLTTGPSLTAFPRQRLDAEQIRDALLAVSGMLDPTPGGAHPFPPATEWDFTQHKQFNAVYPSDKRSVYLMQQRIRRHPFLATFDGADANASTAERVLSTTPLQALFSLNDPFLHEQAEQFADRLLREGADDRQRIDWAHQLAFGRRARRDEIDAGLAYLERFRGKLRELGAAAREESLKAWSSYARAVLGSNEFMFVD